MLSNKAAIWLFIVTTIVLFVIIPRYDQQLGAMWDYWDFIVQFLFIFWFFSLGIVGWSYAIILYMGDRNHWFTPIMIAFVYFLLTKEARVVAKDFYKFNFFKGDEK